MASIEKRPDGRYRARWREYPGGPQRAQHFDRKSDAQRFLDRVRGDLARGDYIDPTAGRVTFREYAETWRRGQVHRPSTVVLVESHLRLHALPFFGDRPLTSIRPSEIQAWVKDRSAVLSPATVQTVYRVTASVFRSAVRDRIITATPCEQIKLPKIARRQIVPLATNAVLRLADAMPDRYRAVIIVASGTGLRQGEVFGLEVRHTDFLKRVARVEQQVISVSGGGAPFLGPPKTPSSVRSVPLPEVVITALARHYELLGLEPTNDRQLIFTNDRGEAIRRTHFAEAFRRAVQAARLPTGTRFHELRHYYASLLIRHGESVKVVQSRLGHASAAETLDTYSHLWPDSEDRTRQAVDEILGGADSSAADPHEEMA
jgi:integrase